MPLLYKLDFSANYFVEDQVKSNKEIDVSTAFDINPTTKNAANINEMIFFIISSLKLNLIIHIQSKKVRIYKLHLTLLIIKKALIK